MAVRFLALTIGFNETVMLKRGMNDPALIRIHGLKRDRPPGLFDLIRDIACQVFQSICPTRTIILGVKL